MRKVSISILIIVLVITTSLAAFAATTLIQKEFNVKNYGAKGDGITDDRAAIQKAIDAASLENGIVLFPASTKSYKISNYLTLKSNITLSGYGATIYMPSQSVVSIMLYGKSSTYISNVSIKGLKLSSTNDRTGTGEYEGSKTSYVEGVSISGVSGLTIQDVYMENLYMGLKLQGASNGLKNEAINVSNLKVYNTRNPLYMSSTNNMKMTNSILDATGGGTKFLHASYFRGGVSNLYFNNVQFNNTPGGGIHIYNSKAELAAPRDIIFDNCSIDNTRAAVYLYTNANNITFNNLSIKNSGLGFKVNSASNIKMNGVKISQASSTKEEKGGFSFNTLKTAQLNNVTIDGTGMAGSVFAVIGSVSDVTATNFNATNIGSIPFTSNSSAVKSMTATNLAISSSYSTGYKITGTATPVPTTEAPTQAPTQAPTTQAPTQAPTTQAPTQAPTTQAPTEAPTQAPTEAPVANQFNVKDYGAKGDGVTDDRLAIQKAIDAASLKNGIVLFPASAKSYKISNYLTLKSNVTLSGYGATIHMPSQSAVSIMFYSKSSLYISNVTVKGLKLTSTNDRIGSGEYEGSKTSYVEGISISGISGLTIQDVTMDNLYMGLKLERSDSGVKNESITVNNLNVYNSRNPLYMAQTNNLMMSNSILDATGGGTKFLHAAYLRGGVSNMTFNNVQFKNTPGGGIHIYNSRAELAAPRDLVFNNCSIDNTRAAVYLYSNASNISFNNLSIKNSGVGFKVNGANNIKMNGVNLTQASSTKEEKGGFSLNNLKYAQLNNVTVDGSGMAGSVFAVIGSVSDVIATNFNATNIGGIPFTNNSSAVKSMTAVNLAISSSYSTGYKILAQ